MKKRKIDKPNHVTKVIVIRVWVVAHSVPTSLTTTNDEDGIKRRYSVSPASDYFFLFQRAYK